VIEISFFIKTAKKYEKVDKSAKFVDNSLELCKSPTGVILVTDEVIHYWQIPIPILSTH
jgi:hypothetical protein